MADKNSLLQFVAQKLGPEKLQQMVDELEQQLGQDPDVTPEVLDQMVNLFSQVAENPDSYDSVIQDAINAGVLDQGDFPEQFDPIFVGLFLLALQELQQQRASQPAAAFARGGLAQAAKKIQGQGRNEDTMLAHISPHEAMFLKRMGGSGTINPQTGLPEFGLGLKKAFKKVAKVAVAVVKAAAPIVATATLGPWAGAAVGAGLGATGGGGWKGALLGGLGASLAPGGVLGGGIPGMNLAGSVGQTVLDSGIGSMLNGVIGPQTLGAGILGGGASALAGKGFLQGALTAGGMAAMTPTVNSLTNKVISPGGLFSTQAGGTGITLPGSGSTVAPATGLNKIGTDLLSASQDGMYDAATNTFTGTPYGPSGEYIGQALDIPSNTGGYAPEIANSALSVGAPAPTVAPAASTGLFGSGLTGSNALLGLTALNALGGMTVPQAEAAIAGSELTPEQKAAMSRNLQNYTASWNAPQLPTKGTPEYDQMMNKIYQGVGISHLNPTLTASAMKKGGRANASPGALSKMAMLASGTGGGRDDTINAKLSDGEYVLDAETVALLGNGSTKAGALVLDQMRQQLRKQKGKALAKGKFSPDAKSPLAYMKGGLK